MLDVGQANEIKLAARAAGATNADLKALCISGMFEKILPVLRGLGTVKLDEIVSRSITVDWLPLDEQELVPANLKPRIDNAVARTIGERVEVFFFNLGRHVSDNDLEKAYVVRGLAPCDVYTFSKVNENDLSFAKDHPNGTHWKDASGRWCYAVCAYDGDQQRIHIDLQIEGDWSDNWWFAGVRK